MLCRVVCFVAGSLAAIACSKINAQVVQLPTISTYQYSGSFLVPDSGTGYYSGSNSLRSSSTQYGRPRSQSLSRVGASGNSSLTARVQDLNAIDNLILYGNPIGPGGNNAPPRTTAVVGQTINNPVADIFNNPSKDELQQSYRAPRRRLNEVSSGDYMMILSHPQLGKLPTKNR